MTQLLAAYFLIVVSETQRYYDCKYTISHTQEKLYWRLDYTNRKILVQNKKRLHKNRAEHFFLITITTLKCFQLSIFDLPHMTKFLHTIKYMIGSYLLFGRYSSTPCLQIWQMGRKEVRNAYNYDCNSRIVQGSF